MAEEPRNTSKPLASLRRAKEGTSHPAQIPYEVGGGQCRRPADPHTATGRALRLPRIFGELWVNPGRPYPAVAPEVAGSSPVVPRLRSPRKSHAVLAASCHVGTNGVMETLGKRWPSNLPAVSRVAAQQPR